MVKTRYQTPEGQRIANPENRCKVFVFYNIDLWRSSKDIVD